MADSMLTIGGNTLSVASYAISVYSNNVANADTDGYRRRTVTLSDTQTILTANGLAGTGVEVAEVQRAFDTYLEALYLAKYTGSMRWDTAQSSLEAIENVFDQSDGLGLDTSLADWFTAWEDLAQYPDDLAVRTALTSATESMTSLIRDMAADLASQEELIDDQLAEQVDDANAIMGQLADLNAQIGAHPGDSSLLDDRDRLVRELSELVDVQAQYLSSGKVVVRTASGQTLVDESEAFELRLEGPRSWSSLTGASTFDGAVYFDGSSSNEITLQVVDPGAADGTATFRVSFDGGRTWQTDADGNVALYAADAASGSVTVDGVEIWFGAADDGSAAASGALASGDTFTVMPKSGLYWYENTSSFMNVTPLSSGGVDLSSRLTGGSITGLLTARDQYLGTYREELDALAASLIWETNYAHSQGAGLSTLSQMTGTYAAQDASAALADSGLAFADRVQSGGLSLALFDATTGAAQGSVSIDFSSVTPGRSTFDPAVHSLDDVAQAITDSTLGAVTATVTNGTLSLQAASGTTFQFAGDTTGLLAACGLNTFLTGTGAEDIALNPLVSDPERVCAAVVDGAGEVNSGGNETALAIAALASSDVTVTTRSGADATTTLQDYFAALVSKVGTGVSSASFSADYYAALASDLWNRQEEVGGVNLDEELIRIEQFQRLYQAASSLIETSNEMFETLIGLV